MSLATPLKTTPSVTNATHGSNEGGTDLQQMLTAMKSTLGTLDTTFQTLNTQSGKLATSGPNMNQADIALQKLRDRIKKKDQKQDELVGQIKKIIQDELKDKIATEQRSFIDNEIKEEIARQVRDQVSIQFKEHIPLSLEERVRGSHDQVVRVRHALQNSEARRKNATLETNNLYDELSVVLKPDGTKSTKWPADLQSLFSYGPPALKELMKDFELSDYGSKEKNLNRFMAHIGIRFQLVSLPEEDS